MTVFVSPTQPIEFKLLRIRNKSDHERLLQIMPAMEIVLAETPNESLGAVAVRDRRGCACDLLPQSAQ